MLIRHSRNAHWLSNSWLVADQVGGNAVLIDTGAPMAPLLQALEEMQLQLTHVFNTHHHQDHIAHNADWSQQFQCPICAHPLERPGISQLGRSLADGEEVRTGDLHVRALHIPGHTQGQLAFLINERAVFTGDTLFRGSVGGTCASGHTTCADLRHSVMEVLMRLPAETAVYPGHMEATSIAREWQENPFLRVWRKADAVVERSCFIDGVQAKLLLRAQDYDGGTKCWVRYPDGREDLVPGSQVEDAKA